MHVPGEDQARSVVELEHVFVGGESQITPAQGSSRHAPVRQPCAHAVSVLE
ncbi:MAG TPA: hypothetical protein VFF06_22445 [Polyangia bacterium]|nr:hypothetical protein [Polyangia bacterium]